MLRSARWLLLGVCALFTAPAVAGAGVNVFIGSPTLPTVLNTTVLAFPGAGAGDLPAPGAAADSTVAASPADGTGDILGPTVGSSVAGNLWVDTNGGTCTRQSSPATYVDAAACTPTGAYSAAQAGDLVKVKGGSYGSWGFNNLTPKGTSALIVYEEAQGETASMSTIDVDNSDNIEFRGLQGFIDIEGGAQHLVFRDHVAQGLNGGMYMCGGTNISLYNVDIGFAGPSDGIDLSGDCTADGSNTNLLFEDVTVHDLNRWDGYPGSGDPPHTDCIQVRGVHGFVVRRMKMLQCSTQGFFIAPFRDDANDILVENSWFGPMTQAGSASWPSNLNSGSGASVNGGGNSGSDTATNIVFRGNTVYGDITGSSSFPYAGNIQFVGNILFPSSQSNCSNNAGSPGMDFDYNVIYGLTSCPGSTNSTFVTGGSFTGSFVASPVTYTPIDGDGQTHSNIASWNMHLQSGAAPEGAGPPGNYTWGAPAASLPLAVDMDDDARNTSTSTRIDAGADEIGGP